MGALGWLITSVVTVLGIGAAGTAAWFFSSDFLSFQFEEVEDVPDQEGDAQRAAPNKRVSGRDVIAQGEKYRSALYRWGGATSKEEGLDCSGLPYRTFRDLGVTIPRVSRAQAAACKVISEEYAKQTPGAMVFFVRSGAPLSAQNVFHVMLSVGDGEHVLESQCWEGSRCTSGQPCKKGVDFFKWGWWGERYAGRVFYGILPHLVEYDNF